MMGDGACVSCEMLDDTRWSTSEKDDVASREEDKKAKVNRKNVKET